MVKKKLGDVLMAAGGDAVWLSDSPQNRAIINTFVTIRGTPHNIETYQKHLSDSLVDRKDPDDPSKLIFPKLQMYPTRIFHRYVWIKEKSFDISEHVYVYDKCIPDSVKELQELMGEICSKELQDRKAPWEWIIVPPKNNNSDKFYIMFRCHHSIADGVSLVKVFIKCVVDSSPEDPEIQRFGAQNMWIRVIKCIFEGPGLLLATLLKREDRNMLHGAPLSGNKLVAWSDKIELDLIKKMKSCTGTTVNDVLMSCLAGAFREYMLKNSSNMPQNIRAFIPVDMRQSKELVLDNQFGLVLLNLPLDEEDPKELLIRTKKRMDAIKASTETLVSNWLILYGMARVPSTITTLALDWFSRKSSMVLSNIPGPTRQLSITGQELEDVMFWPPQRSNIGIGVSIQSYNGGLRIGIMSDKAVLTNPSILAAIFVEKVYELASQLKVE